MKKKLLSLVMVLCMVLSLMPSTALATETTATDLGGAVSNLETTTLDTVFGSGNYEYDTATSTIALNKSIQISKAIVIDTDVTCTIDLNGFTIDRGLTEATSEGYVIKVEGTLTVKDSNTGGVITGGNNSDYYAGGVYVYGGSFALEGGSISGNTNSHKSGYGGGVYLGNNASGNGSTFNMSGGSITGNSASNGGGVYNSGTFHMTGGSIAGNTAACGGGVYHSGGALTGTIGVTTDSTFSESETLDVAVSKTGDSAYNITADDAAKFVSDSDSYHTEFESTNSKVVLAFDAATLPEAEWTTPTDDIPANGTFAAGLKALNKGGSIKLLQNVSTTEKTWLLANEITLDLNGKTWSSGGIQVNGTLTLMDTGTGGGITAASETVVSVATDGTFVMQSGKITATERDCHGIHNNGTLKLSGGTVESEKLHAINNDGDGKLYLSGAPTITTTGTIKNIVCVPSAKIFANDGDTSTPSYSTGSISIQIPSGAGWKVNDVVVSGLEDAGHAGKFTFGSSNYLTTLYDDTDKTIKLVHNSYVINYKDAGGGNYTGLNMDSLPTTHTYNTATTLVDGVKDGYTFAGWFTDSACTGANKVTALDATAYTAAITLYAKWTANATEPTEKTATPVFENGYNLGQGGDNFYLTNDYASKENTKNTTYRLYAAATGDAAPAGMTIKPGDYGGFQVGPVSASTDCYVTATAPGFLESDRAPLRLLAKYTADGVTVAGGQVNITTPAQLQHFLNYCTPGAATLAGNTVTLTKDTLIRYDINLENGFSGVFDLGGKTLTHNSGSSGWMLATYENVTLTLKNGTMMALEHPALSQYGGTVILEGMTMDGASSAVEITLGSFTMTDSTLQVVDRGQHDWRPEDKEYTFALNLYADATVSIVSGVLKNAFTEGYTFASRGTETATKPKTLASCIAPGSTSDPADSTEETNIYGDPTQICKETITVTNGPIVAVTGITGVPTAATAYTDLTLTGTVAPANASNKTIVWSVKDAGTTGATISGSTLKTTAGGTASITATIKNGKAVGTHFTQDFTVTVTAPPDGILSAPLSQTEVDSAFGPGNVTFVSPDKVVINKDLDLKDTIKIETDVTIDLNGNTITGATGDDGSGKPAFTVDEDKTLTIIDSKDTGSVTGGAGSDNASGNGGNGGAGITGPGNVVVGGGGSVTGGAGGNATGGGSGGNGGNGVDLDGDGSVTVESGNVSGGNGATGGDGAKTENGNIVIKSDGSANGGNGTNGGNGSETTGTGNITINGDSNGGNSTETGNGGNGAVTDSGNITVGENGTANGGIGGSGSGSTPGGTGGSGTNTGSGNTTVNGDVTGGNGGNGANNGAGNGGNGGNGANGNGTISGSGTITGGNGGNIPDGGQGTPGNGGSAITGGGNDSGFTGIKNEGKKGLNANAKVEVKLDTPTVTVPEENLIDGAVTDEERVDNTISKIDVTLTVEKKDDKPDSDKVEAAKPSGSTIGLYLDIKLEKTVTTTGGQGAPVSVTEAVKPITITIVIPEDLRGGSNYRVIRNHDNAAKVIDSTYDAAKNTLTFETDKFSTYAIAYTPKTPVTPPTPPYDGGSDSGSTSSAPAPIVTKSDGGTVTLNPTRPRPGQTVTATPKPDAGYVVDEVIVTDQNGKKIAVKDNGDGTYSYTQPSGKVIITVTFKPEDVRLPWNPFADVTERDWFYDSVKCVYEKGLMNGTSDTAFRPYTTTSRGMIVTILWRLEGEPTAKSANPYADVSTGAYYAKAVAWAAENGIVKGYDNGNFGPNDPITREQLAAILYRYTQFKGIVTPITGDLSQFTDQPSTWAADAMQWAVGVGIISGRGNGTLDATGNATRAQTSAMLARFLN